MSKKPLVYALLTLHGCVWAESRADGGFILARYRRLADDMRDMHFPGFNPHYLGPRDIIAGLALIILIVLLCFLIHSNRDREDD